MKKQIPILALCLTLGLTACSPKPPAEAEPSATPQTTASAAPVATPTPVTTVPTPSQLPTESTVPAPQWNGEMTTVIGRAQDGIELLRFEMLAPRIENAEELPAFQAINAFYEQEAQVFQQEAQAQEEWARDDYAVSQAANFPFMPYVEQYTYEITRQTSRYVSISRELYANTGGAYPTVYRFGEQFDFETGQQMVLADVFTDVEAGLAVVREEITRQNAGEPDLGIEESALTAAFAPERFYLTDEGIVLYYQGADLGPFHNPVEYTIAYDKLEKELATWIAD